MKDVTLCFLLKTDDILLAMKKRGFGVGKLNGVGGKVKNETIEEGVRREAYEEIGVQLRSISKVAELMFVSYQFRCHVYFCTSWEGEPQESEEMSPQWYAISAIPYEQMWDDDKIWLPQVLAGKKLAGSFEFDEQGNVKTYTLSEVTSFG